QARPSAQEACAARDAERGVEGGAVSCPVAAVRRRRPHRRVPARIGYSRLTSQQPAGGRELLRSSRNDEAVVYFRQALEFLDLAATTPDEEAATSDPDPLAAPGATRAL